MNSSKITTESIRAMKARGEKVAALTAYDFPMAKLLDEAGIPLLLVGDSLGMVVLGYSDTTHVTMAEMEHHTRAAARARPRAVANEKKPPFHQFGKLRPPLGGSILSWRRILRSAEKPQHAGISSKLVRPTLQPYRGRFRQRPLG